MAWITPKTFLSNTELTSADLNMFVRDNLLETERAKAGGATGWFVSNGPNSIARRRMYSFENNTISTTSSTTPVNLNGPSGTIEHGGAFLAIATARIKVLSGSGIANCGIHIDGGSGTHVASIGRAIRSAKTFAINGFCHVFHYNVPVSLNTVRLQYWVSSGSAEFNVRKLDIWTL